MRAAVLSLAALAAFLPAAAFAQVAVGSQPMEFDACKRAVADTSAQLGIQPLVMVETDDLYTVRWITAQGMIMTSCSRFDGVMTTTKSE